MFRGFQKTEVRSFLLPCNTHKSEHPAHRITNPLNKVPDQLVSNPVLAAKAASSASHWRVPQTLDLTQQTLDVSPQKDKQSPNQSGIDCEADATGDAA